MNVKLLRKIQKAILAKPERYDQNETCFPNSSCGTKACIGGWVQHFTKSADWGTRLGLDEAQLWRLCSGTEPKGFVFGHKWPLKFLDAYKNAKTPAGRARVAVRRIDHFIKTNGAE